jgi:hypothetical protein
VTFQTVHVRINDAATGQPTPVRVRFTDDAGDYYAPLGRLTDFATGRNQDVGGNARLGMKPWAYVDGAFEINLPPGTIHVAIRKGPEYRPLEETIQLRPGKLAQRFTIERWVDMPAQSWYSGDGRVHFLSPHAALLEARAEDVHVVNLLVTPTDAGNGKTALSNILAFSGQKPALETPGYMVVVNTLNTDPKNGSLALLNCHRVVYPLDLDGSLGWERWTMADWCGQCHRKNGLVVWTSALPVSESLRGQIDAFEISDQNSSMGRIYELWNAGWQLPLVGSSGKESNAAALGSLRTFAQIHEGDDFNYKSWIEAVRAGRTFVTNGPLLFFSANDTAPGGILTPKANATVRLRAEAKSLAPTERLEILLNGNVIAATEREAIELDLPASQPGWLAARCLGTQFAHSSPIYLAL